MHWPVLTQLLKCRNVGQIPAAVCIILLVMTMMGCIIAIPTPRCILTPSGYETKLPDEYPVPGKMTQQEIEKYYEDVGVDTGVPTLFWGRFKESTLAVAIIGGKNDIGTQVWSVQNLVVSFFADGSIKSIATIEDDKLLFNKFRELLKEERFPPIDLTQPIRVVGYRGKQRNNHNFTLHLNEVELTLVEEWLGTSKKPAPPARRATIPLAQLKK